METWHLEVSKCNQTLLVNLECTYAQQKPWMKCSTKPLKVENSNATLKNTPWWKAKTWWGPSKFAKTLCVNPWNESKEPNANKNKP